MAASNAFSQVEIETLDGRDISGFIIHSDDNSVRLQLAEGIEVDIKTKNIRKINKRYSTIHTTGGGELEAHISLVNDSAFEASTKDGFPLKIDRKNIMYYSFDNLSSQYPFIGLTLVQPGGFNLTGGGHFSDVLGIRATVGMVPGSMFGTQFNLLYSLSRLEHFESNISILGGYSIIERGHDYYGQAVENDMDWLYFGTSIDANIYGIFLELGLTVGSGYFSNPQLLFQIGYVYRFND
jgi:hypothetical protein